jgi:capsid protein
MRPSTAFEPYLSFGFTLIGASVGLPLILLLLDFSKTNYSSARFGLEQAKMAFRRWQRFLQLRYYAPMTSRALVRGIAAGELPPDRRIYSGQWNPPGWQYVDIEAEAEGHALMIASGQSDELSVAASRGLDYEDIQRNRAKARQIRERYQTGEYAPLSEEDDQDSRRDQRREQRRADRIAERGEEVES